MILQVGSCIVNEDGQVVGVGYNGFVKGIDDDDKTIPWAPGKDKPPINQKMPYGKDHNNNYYVIDDHSKLIH
jgi:hypothetical protein